MMGIGETYISAFALFLKASTPQIGLLASLPPLLGSLAQILSAALGRLTGRRKPIILVGASIQAFAWLPIALLPLLFSEHAVAILITCVTAYHCGAHLAAPQWASLMGDLVPPKRRGRFFARRTRVIALVTFLSLATGGQIQQAATAAGWTLAGFLSLFTIAMAARAVSTYHLSRMQDPAGHVAALQLPAREQWWRQLVGSNFVRFSMFYALMQFAVAIASPFFAVYMLRDLQFTYAQFMANTGMSVLAQFLTLSQWGRISDVFGNRRVLSVTGLMLPLMPLLWVFSQDFWYLLLVQLISGMSWAGFTLGATNFLYDLVSRENRASYLAVHNVLSSVGIFCGAVLGGYLGLILPRYADSFAAPLMWFGSLLGVFAISAALRMIVLLILLPKIREVRRVRPISFADVIFRVTRVNALAGMMFDIIGSRPRRETEIKKPADPD
ncbi:MAG: MFS transporter [Woeseiaceae bacterium]|nr:MFS transporter [Woeseiaceae bacterium]